MRAPPFLANDTTRRNPARTGERRASAEQLTFFRPFCVSAEHSKYLTALIRSAIACGALAQYET